MIVPPEIHVSLQPLGVETAILKSTPRLDPICGPSKPRARTFFDERSTCLKISLYAQRSSWSLPLHRPLGQQIARPIAVCHIHRRRGVLWRDILQPRLDPKAGFGERLLFEGLAVLREEVWWAPGYNASPPGAVDSTTEASTHAHHRRSTGGGGGGDAPVVRDGDDSEQPFPALKRLLEDRERFIAAEKSAELAKRGVWELTPREDGGRDKAAAGVGGGGVMSTGLKQRSAAVARAFVSFFGRGQK